MPSSAETQNLVSLYRQGRIEDALIAGSALLAQHPEDPSLNNMVGVLYARLGRLDEALIRYEKALALREGYAEALNNRGNALFRMDQHADAAESYRQAVAAMPDYADAHNGLANALLALGQYAEAASVFDHASRLQPGLAQAHAGAAKALSRLGYYREALERIEAAIRLSPDNAAWHNELGNILCDHGRPRDGVAAYEKALELDAELIEVYGNLGNARLDMGDVDAALAAYEETLRRKPDYAEMHYNRAFAMRFADDGESLEQLRDLAAGEAIGDSDRCYLCFALAKALEDHGDVDQAFDWYARGNRLRKNMLGYDITADRDQLSEISRIYREQVGQIAGNIVANEKPDTVPIFIVGMPRSGTSLVEQILASHSKVFGAGELNTASRILMPLLQGHPSSPRLDAAMLTRVREAYLADVDYLARGAPVVTDKMPGNFRWIGFLLAALPEARVVHVRRNPVATCWSMYKRLFSSNGFANDLEDLAEYYLHYEDLMAFWHEALPGRIHDLDYEPLTVNQETETRRLLEYCGLPWEDACLDFHKTERAVRTASSEQVRREIYRGSSEAWRPYKPHLGPLLERLKART